MFALLRKFMADDRGLETVEYAVIAGLIVATTLTTILSIAMSTFEPQVHCMSRKLKKDGPWLIRGKMW